MSSTQNHPGAHQAEASKLLLTHEDMAKSLCIAPRTLDKLVHQGCPRLKLAPRVFRYDPAEVIGWMKSRRDS